MEKITIQSRYKNHLISLLESSRQISNMVSKFQWQVQPSTAHKWRKIFPLVSETNITKLTFQGCDSPVLKDPIYRIIHISFPSLQKLYLGHTNIQSIVGLEYLDAPNLIELSLVFNQLTNIKPLRRTNFKNLKCLWLNGNQISELNVLSELQSNNHMNRIVIDFLIDDRPQGQNINWVAKLAQTRIDIFYLQAPQRIVNRSLQRMLVNKYQRGRFGRNV